MMERIPDKDLTGLTTTIPVEVVFAAGDRPCDLNNIFIASGRAPEMVAAAERAGFPENSCAWTKGIYAAAREIDLRRLIAVTEGDCSNTHGLMEMLEADGVEVIPFAFPFRRDTDLLQLQLERFATALGADLESAEAWKPRLDAIRALALEIDRLSWQEGKARGAEVHQWTIACSDFFGDPDRFEREAGSMLDEIRARRPRPPRMRIALLGIPPICEGLFEILHTHDADVVFDEIPRQFAMPFKTASLLEQYRRYTYPYDVFGRIDDIRTELDRREIHGAVHYVQSFCYRQVEDVLLRRALDLPLLTLECDRPGRVDGRTETRLEAFLEMLARRIG